MAQDGLGFKIENDILKGSVVPDQFDHASLGKFVLDQLESSPDFVGQVDGVTGESFTYQRMRERSVRCALWMRSQGLLAGDIVAICSHSQPDVPITCFATLYLGAAFSPWDARLNSKDFCHLLNLVKPKIAFVSQQSAAAFAEAAQEVSPDLKIVVFGQVPGFLEFGSVIAEPEAEDIENFSCAEIESLDDVASIICTSGTTGMPKGVALNHRTWFRQTCTMNKNYVTEGSCAIFSSPAWLSWSNSVFMSLTWKLTYTILPPFEEHLACALIEKYKPNLIFLASNMINRLLKSVALEKYDLSSPAFYIYGGSPLPFLSHETFCKLIPNATILTGYGMTELGAVSTMTARLKPGSCGQITKNAQLKIIDPNTGRVLGANQKGELLAKTGTMMNFYYNNPKVTAEKVDEEGWLHTGDFGYYDEDGEIFVLDRVEELIECRGHQVSPSEIEGVMLSHPGVKEVGVVGIPHPLNGEQPAAFVVKAGNFLDTGKEVTETELMELVAAKLSDSKRLRDGVRFLDRLPKSSSDKIQRKQLRELATKSMMRM